MTVVLITNTNRYIGDTADTKPTSCPTGSTYFDRQTGILYITYNGGTNWVEKPSEDTLATLIGEVQASPTENTVLDRLKDLLTGIVLAAGSAAIGKLAANDGVDIGDVSVNNAAGSGAYVRPGTAATWDVADREARLLGVLSAGANLIGKVQPFAAVIEGGLTELIDKDDTEVSLNDYSKSVSVALGGSYSGEILAVSLYATELGTGAVRANSGYLLVFDADPTVSAGDTALTIADWQSCIAKILVSDWISDTGGGMATMEVGIPFHALSTLYFVFLNQGAAWNDAAGDDEELHMNLWYRRDS